MRYLGIDYGKKRVGVALSDEKREFALPNSVVLNNRELIKKIAYLCKENDVSVIVIGKSINYKGEENALMKDIRSFAKKLEAEVIAQIVFEPEFLTSAEAERIQGKHAMLDASAAALILKAYIDRGNEKQSGKKTLLKI